MNQTIPVMTPQKDGMKARNGTANRVRITKSRAGSHPRAILNDSGKIQLPVQLKQINKTKSPEPFQTAADARLNSVEKQSSHE